MNIPLFHSKVSNNNVLYFDRFSLLIQSEWGNLPDSDPRLHILNSFSIWEDSQFSDPVCDRFRGFSGSASSLLRVDHILDSSSIPSPVTRN